MKLTRSEEKRSAILAAAWSEFLANGFHATSVDRIAERAQVSKRTVYNHFQSKERLFQTIATRIVADKHDDEPLPYQADQPLDEQLTRICQREVEAMTSEDTIAGFRMLLAEGLTQPDLVEPVVEAAMTKDDPIETWLEDACRDGRMKIPDIELATEQFYGLLKGIFFWPLVAGYATAPEGEARKLVIESNVQMFLGFYRDDKRG